MSQGSGRWPQAQSRLQAHLSCIQRSQSYIDNRFVPSHEFFRIIVIYDVGVKQFKLTDIWYGRWCTSVTSAGGAKSIELEGKGENK